jgi:hypothetical protein
MTRLCLYIALLSIALGAGIAIAQGDPPEAAAESAGRGIFRVWVPRTRSQTVARELLPLTAAARAAVASPSGDDLLSEEPLSEEVPGDRAVTDQTAGDRGARPCQRPGMPLMLDTDLPVAFIERGDRILMRFDEWDDERIIYMNPASGPPQQAHSAKGVSFGRWEGETLAIFTLYIDFPVFDRRGTPQSRDVTVLERYTPSADGARLDWIYTVTDPATFETPVTRTGQFGASSTGGLEPRHC